MAANQLAYGFVNLTQHFAEKVTTVGVRTVYDAVVESAAEHSRALNELLGRFASPVIEHQLRFKLPGSGTLQPIDENGIPLPVQESGYYDVAFPIQGGGTAFGFNRITEKIATVEDVNRTMIERMQSDADWLRRHLLAAIFTNTTWTYGDKEFGNLTIQPLANSDAVTYVLNGGAAAADSHYLAQAGAISDLANPFGTIYDELMEHPSNEGSDVLVYAPTNLIESIEALTGFVPVGDNDLNYGIGATTLRNIISEGFGDRVVGKAKRCWIIEYKALPSSYMIAHAANSTGFVGMRQYDAPELQGLFVENHSPDGALRETRLLRFAGFGVVNRVAACVMRIGNGSYAIPTGYTAPLAI